LVQNISSHKSLLFGDRFNNSVVDIPVDLETRHVEGYLAPCTAERVRDARVVREKGKVKVLAIV
jgi:hypothetical protein